MNDQDRPAWKIPAEWVELAREYHVQPHGDGFPMNAVSRAFYGDDLESVWMVLLTKDAGHPEQIEQRIRQAEADRDEIEALRHVVVDTDGPFRWRPELLDGVDYLLSALKQDLSVAKHARYRLDRLHWKVNPTTGRIAKSKTGREWINEATCRLHDALRPAFDAAFPDQADQRIPRLLRMHLRRILEPFFDDLPTDRQMDDVIREHLERPKT